MIMETIETKRPAWNKGLKTGIVPSNAYKKGSVPYSKTVAGLGIMNAWNKGMKLPNQSGKNHHAWIEDRSLLKRQDERIGNRHKHWSKSVKNRDGWRCKISNGDCSGQVVAHHILPWRDYKELRYEVNNGITLCHFHHPRKRNDEIKLSPYFQELIKVD